MLVDCYEDDFNIDIEDAEKKITKKLNQDQLQKIAEEKAADMNTDNVEAVKKMVAGTARSMGVEVES